jgi:hypothetical protein
LSAQVQNSQVISDRSQAALFIGTRNDPTAFGAGVARVGGEASVNRNNLSASIFNFNIYSGLDKADLGTDIQALTSVQPVISFQSQRVSERSDGRFAVSGLLTVTRLERNAMVNPGEDYSGPVYSAPQLSRSSHYATFFFAPLAVSTMPTGDAGDVVLLEAQESRPSQLLLTATGMVSGEAFPELSNAVGDSIWPPLVNDEQCSISSMGEDYHGSDCTGTVIEPLSSDALPVQTGEDYSGIQVTPPSGELITIYLHVELANSNAAATSLSENRKSMETVMHEASGW